MKEVTVQELKQKLDDNETFQLIDVREEHEYDEANLNGELIPMGEIMLNTDKISNDKPVILYCRSGVRSGTIISALEKQHGFTNLHNLKGGIKAWATEIDTSITVS